MPTLDWIGKRAVLAHHKDVPYRTLMPVAELSCSPSRVENRDWSTLRAQVAS